MFNISTEENVLVTALQSRMEHFSEAANAAWEYYNLQRSFDTYQSLQNDKQETKQVQMYVNRIV